MASPRLVNRYRPLMVMALGALLTGIGVGLFGLVQGLGLFAVAMTIFTFGEMVTAPVGQSLAAQFAPEAMRGRYLALFDMSSVLPMAFGPYLAGLIMENYQPTWVWLAAFPLGFLLTGCYLAFDLLWHRRQRAGKLVVGAA